MPDDEDLDADDFEIEECMQCGWAFAGGGTRHEWVPSYGPMMGVRVGVCDPCYWTTTIGTVPSPEQRAISYCTNLVLAAIERAGQRSAG